MKFEEILPHLKKGKKAYRKSENQLEFTTNYVYFDFGRNEILRKYSQSSHNVPSFVDFNDLVADDWEVVEQGIGGEKMSELMPLEEAISDYQQAREDYLKKVEEAKNFFKIDRQVFESILRIHFNASEVYVFDNEVKLIYIGDEQNEGFYEKNGVFYDNIPEEARGFLKNRKYIHKYIESNKDTSKMEITFNID